MSPKNRGRLASMVALLLALPLLTGCKEGLWHFFMRSDDPRDPGQNFSVDVRQDPYGGTRVALDSPEGFARFGANRGGFGLDAGGPGFGLSAGAAFPPKRRKPPVQFPPVYAQPPAAKPPPPQLPPVELPPQALPPPIAKPPVQTPFDGGDIAMKDPAGVIVPKAPDSTGSSRDAQQRPEDDDSTPEFEDIRTAAQPVGTP